ADRRRDAGPLQVRSRLDPRSPDLAVRTGGGALAGGSGALAVVPVDRAFGARARNAGPHLARGPVAPGARRAHAGCRRAVAAVGVCVRVHEGNLMNSRPWFFWLTAGIACAVSCSPPKAAPPPEAVPVRVGTVQ